MLTDTKSLKGSLGPKSGLTQATLTPVKEKEGLKNRMQNSMQWASKLNSQQTREALLKYSWLSPVTRV